MAENGAKRFTVAFDGHMAREVTRLAAAEGVSLTEIVRKSVSVYAYSKRKSGERNGSVGDPGFARDRVARST